MEDGKVSEMKPRWKEPTPGVGIQGMNKTAAPERMLLSGGIEKRGAGPVTFAQHTEHSLFWSFPAPTPKSSHIPGFKTFLSEAQVFTRSSSQFTYVLPYIQITNPPSIDVAVGLKGRLTSWFHWM